MIILGLSAFNHDASVSLLVDGQLAFAASEERYSRVKHDAGFPAGAASAALSAAGLNANDIDAVAYYERPDRVLARRLWTAVRWPASAALLPRRSLDLAAILDARLGYRGHLIAVPHHLSHAVWAYKAAGIESSAILTVDGVGEWATVTGGTAVDSKIDMAEIASFPNSLGLFYALITGFLGFNVNSGEYKVMGLASFGQPTLLQQLSRVIELDRDGSLRIASEFFDFVSGTQMHSPAFEALVGMSARREHEPLEQIHADLAASAQSLLEEVLLGLSRRLQARTGQRSLCLGGGVALNCCAVARLTSDGPFDRVFAPPAPGDDGAAVGAAYAAALDLGEKVPCSAASSMSLGDTLDTTEIDNACSTVEGAERFDDARLFAVAVAKLLDAGFVVARAVGRAEFGPRALGNRSILADPRNAEMRERINAYIKEREAFRPFAPAVLLEHAAGWFASIEPTPFMQKTVKVLRPDDIPAVTHVDGTSRLQTVDRTENPDLASLLDAFLALTGCPVLLNTSLNLSGEPIAQTVDDVIRTFLFSGCDALALGPWIVDRDAARSTWRGMTAPVRGEGGRPPSTSVYSIF